MRKLAQIVRVASLEPIVTINDQGVSETADNIVLAKMQDLGWQCVVKKNEFQEGGLAVFLEIDAVPPDSPDFSWLWQPKRFKPGDMVFDKVQEDTVTVHDVLPDGNLILGTGLKDENGEDLVSGPVPPSEVRIARPANFRIKTMKLRKQLSQGLLVPFDIVGPHLDPDRLYSAEDLLGMDVSEMLGVTKYDPPEINTGGPNRVKARSTFHPLVPKTDETRVQAYKKVLFELAGKPFVATIKLDGTSATFAMKKSKVQQCMEGGESVEVDEFHCFSRNQSTVDEPGNLYWNIARKYNLEGICQANPTLAIQGEIVGPSIQGNPLCLKEPDFFVFSIYEIEEKRYLSHDEVQAFCSGAELKTVPVEWEGDAFYPILLNFENEPDQELRGRALTAVMNDLLMKAEGKYAGTKVEREGLVFRPREELWSAALGGRLSFKVISNKFLLNKKD